MKTAPTGFTLKKHAVKYAKKLKKEGYTPIIHKYSTRAVKNTGGCKWRVHGEK
jgi:hypothetical protein